MTEEINYEDLIVPVPDELIFKTKSGKEIRLKMYYKQLVRLSTYASQNPVLFENYMMNDEVQTTFIDLITCRFDDKGDPYIPEDIEEFKENMTVEQALEISSWCAEHVNNFFMRKLRNQEAILKKNEAQYKARENLLKRLGVLPQKNEEKENSKPSQNG